MYYNAKKLLAVNAEIQKIVDELKTNTVESMWTSSNYKTSDVEKLFKDQNIDILKYEHRKGTYSWSTWSLEDFLILQKELKTLITQYINNENRQSIPDSVIDTFIEESRDAEIGAMKFMYGDLGQREQNIMRNICRKVHEYTKSRKYE